MMSRSCRAVAAALSLLIATPALAADNYTIQSGGTSRTIRAKEVGGVLSPMSIAVDGAGLERFTNANPGYVTFPSGTVLAISATALPLPAGAATAAAQATGNTALGSPSDAAWDGTAASASITAILKGLPRTSGGGGTASSVTVTALPATAATAANQATANTALASIDTKTPAKGAATSANSSPVVIASDQAPIPVTGSFSSSIGASELHIGSVGGESKTVAVTPVIQARAYTAGQCMGGVQTLAGITRVAGKGSILQSGTLRSKIANTQPIDMIVFRDTPTDLTGLVDASACIVGATDLDKVTKVISFASWSSLGGPAISNVDGISKLTHPASGTDLKFILVARGSITTTSTSDLSTSIAAIND